MAVNNPARLEVQDEEDWFGEGSAFDSGEDLAAALFAMAGAREVGSPVVAFPAGRAVDTLVTAPAQPVGDDPEPAAQHVRGAAEADTTDSKPAPRSWSVRSAAADTLPPRQRGRSGWSIRNSVKVLHRTESVMERLREQAVLAAFAAAARAFSPES